PKALAAFAAGDVSSSHLSLMARTADQVGLEPVQEQEEVLVEAARQLDPRMFRQVTEHLRHCVDPDGALKDANQAHERRAVWISETMDGLFILNGTLDPEGGAILRTALAAVEGKPVAGDERSARQRRPAASGDRARRRCGGRSCSATSTAASPAATGRWPGPTDIISSIGSTAAPPPIGTSG